jgi:hypothetical protein
MSSLLTLLRQSLLTGALVKKLGRVHAPPRGKTLFVVVDDVSMPAVP